MSAYNPDQQTRIHQGRHTFGRIDCPACAQAHQVLHQALPGELLFSEAFAVWMSHRTIETNGQRVNARYLAENTDRDYRCCARALERFPPFRELSLDQIGPEQLMDYQEARAMNAPDSAGAWWCATDKTAHGPYSDREGAEIWAKKHRGSYEIRQTIWPLKAAGNRIRKEVALIVRILRDARLWGQDEEDIFLRLRPMESEIVRAMTVAEQHRFLHVAAGKLSYRLIYQYAIVALQTTASTNEMRALRLRDVLLEDRIIQVPPAGAKNTYRMRAIPIVTEDCMWALEGLIQRARELGSVEPSHYLFPLRVNPGRCGEKTLPKEHYDPSRPMSSSGLKKQWDVVRRAALLPDLRIYDLRHTGITRMAEAGVPIAVAMTFAGHMTRQMQQRYTAICMASQRGWGATVWGDGDLRKGGSISLAEDVASAKLAHKPVRAESSQMYQEGQYFHRLA